MSNFHSIGVIAAVGFSLGQPVADLSDLGFLAGCWELRSGNRTVEEQWMAPKGELMLGMSRTAVGDAVRGWEHLIIRQEGDELIYVAAPSGQAVAEFRSPGSSRGAVTFENLQHDFPQRIQYRSAAMGDSLIGRIEGVVDGREVSSEFPYGRVACAVG